MCSTKERPAENSIPGAQAAEPYCSPISWLPVVCVHFLRRQRGPRRHRGPLCPLFVPDPHPSSKGTSLHRGCPCVLLSAAVLLCDRCVIVTSGKGIERPRVGQGRPHSTERLRRANPAPGFPSWTQVSRKEAGARPPSLTPDARRSGPFECLPGGLRGPRGNCISPALNHRPAPGTVPSWGPMCPLPDPSSVVAASVNPPHIRRCEMRCGHCSKASLCGG